MKNDLKQHIRSLLFTLGGAAVGFAYYCLIGCRQGSCAIGARPLRSTLYVAVIGFLISLMFEKKDRDTEA